MDQYSSILSEQKSFFLTVYKDLKLSLFLSETDPNICLLYNDGTEIQTKLDKKLLGFVIHSACSKHTLEVPVSAILLFSNLDTGPQNT